MRLLLRACHCASQHKVAAAVAAGLEWSVMLVLAAIALLSGDKEMSKALHTQQCKHLQIPILWELP